MRPERGFSLIEILLSAVLILIAALAAVAHVTRTVQFTDWSQDKVYARQKAVSILAELRAYVEGGEGEVAADLDGFDDGLDVHPTLTIAPDPNDPGAYVEPDHPLSDNVRDVGEWRWYRRITVRRFPGVNTRDLRICTVRVYRMHPKDQLPGEQMAEVSSVIRTIGDAYPTTQVYDVYLLALENVPGWWVYMDAIQPFIEATFLDLESRNPGLEFRAHWITRLGYGRDDEYAPYTNEELDSVAKTPWAYVYPGRLPTGEAAYRYYVGERMGARVNLDGQAAPLFTNGYAAAEPYTDTDGNGRRDPGEPYEDVNGNATWDMGNPAPYALADMHNHCMRWPEAQARFEARVAAGLETDDTPTWRLLLDRMIADPARYHNAILINLHGELLPMPPARNVSDPARIPETRPGWRAVTHPELLRSEHDKDVRFRVYAWKAEFHDTEVLTTQEEPLQDLDGNGVWDMGEAFADWNGNGVWDAGLPISVVLPGGDLAGTPADPLTRVYRLPGGVDADGNGTPDDYVDWDDAPTYPEAFEDDNGDGLCQIEEPWFDVNGNQVLDPFEQHQELDGDGVLSLKSEKVADVNDNDRFDPARPAEPFQDVNGNERWDAAEPYHDWDKNGQWTPPTAPLTPRQDWDPADFGIVALEAAYVAAYGEPFLDLDEDDQWDAAEPFLDTNANGVQDGGFERGEMWYEISYDAVGNRTVLRLHGTPLETPYLAGTQRGLPTACRLYDYDYVPCPTPDSAGGGNRFEWDLYETKSNRPKNTARWILEVPKESLKTAFESSPGAADGHKVDRVLSVETRFGTDLETGTLWPVRNAPQNLSRTYLYYVDDPESVPFSERYQFQGDPRHSPYADTDCDGDTFRDGYNWYFDDFADGSYNAQGHWLAFDKQRMRDGWLGRSAHDVPRLLSWVRTALVQTEAVYTTLTGFSYYYLSVGGDVGYDAANGFANSIPMDGTPFGLTGKVYENTIIGEVGTSSIRGSRKLVRSNDGGNSGIRSSGLWWSKPWLGEIFPDDAYVTQWVPDGNLQAAGGTAAGSYHLIRRGGRSLRPDPQGNRSVGLRRTPGGRGFDLPVQHRLDEQHLSPPGQGRPDGIARRRRPAAGRELQLPDADHDVDQSSVRSDDERHRRCRSGVRLHRHVSALFGGPRAPVLRPRVGADGQRPGLPRVRGQEAGRLRGRQRDRPDDGVRLRVHRPIRHALTHPLLLRGRRPGGGSRHRAAAAPDHPQPHARDGARGPLVHPRAVALGVGPVGRRVLHGQLPQRIQRRGGRSGLRAHVLPRRRTFVARHARRSADRAGFDAVDRGHGARSEPDDQRHAARLGRDVDLEHPQGTVPGGFLRDPDRRVPGVRVAPLQPAHGEDLCQPVTPYPCV